MSQSSDVRLPWGILGLSLMGATFLILGLLSLGDGPATRLHPMFERAAIAWGLIAVGGLMSLIDMAYIVSQMLKQSTQNRE